jgi:hypothetical protein
MILKAISKYLTEHSIEHHIFNTSICPGIGISPKHPNSYTTYNIRLILYRDNTITLYKHNLKTLNYTTIHLADPQLLPKLLKLL